MRRSLSSAAALLAASALFGFATPVLAEGQPAQQAAPAPEQGANPSAEHGQPNRKPSATNDQSGPSNAVPAPDTNSQGDRSTHSVSGRAGKEEPGSHAPTVAQGEQPSPVLVNGAWNVPGAPTDSQTIPAKYSARNDAIDKTPIMAMSLGLTDAQKRAIVEAVGRAGMPTVQTSAKPAEELPWGVALHDLPDAASDPTLPDVKYVRTPDRILLVRPANRIVVGEIKS
jgi:hypothetical protein